jgi:hypothetical protein
MSKVTIDLLMAVDSGMPSILLSLDISVAFDMLDHTRLLQRAIELFGLDGQVISVSSLTLRIASAVFPLQIVALPLLVVLQVCRKALFLDHYSSPFSPCLLVD